jgi:ribosomal protein S24E
MSSTVLKTEHLCCSVHRRELAAVMNVPDERVQVSKFEEVFGRHSI